MPTLLFRFPAGRYHATTSGSHVNEGIIEWPPSPWRLLRALIACGNATLGWRGVPETGRRLFEVLASHLPRYRLPSASTAHSRHYMPLGVLDKGKEKTTLVFDTWARITGTLAVRWDCDLDAEAVALLEVLTENLGYLGRSESWVEAAVAPDDVELPAGFDAYPHQEGTRPGHGWEQVALMATETPAAYSRWREQMVEGALRDLGPPTGKKLTQALKKKRDAAVEPFPTGVIECLMQDSAWWKEHRWSQPPGSRRVLYWRRSDALSVGPPVQAQRPATRSVQTMLLALATPSGRTSSLPSIRRTLPQAELLHRALVRRADNTVVPELTGRAADGAPLKDHRHAHIFPLDLDGDLRIDHVLVHAEMGLSGAAQSAIRALRQTWTRGSAAPLQIAIAGLGDLPDLRRLPEPLANGIERLLGSREGTRVWTSVTPFVPPRHPKPRGKHTLEGQVLSELVCRGFEAPRVERLDWGERPDVLQMRHTVRVRRPPAPAPPVDAGFPLRLIFTKPVCGPIAIGYGSHFGLGLFGAEGLQSGDRSL